jgi:predicted HAD superfamily Cof-like phosphohydrolase
MVYKFHFAFDHPVAPSSGRIMSEPRRVARTSWLLEELVEFMAAEELDDQADALLDFLYFCFGNFIEIGTADVTFLDVELDNAFNNTGCPAALGFGHRVSFAGRASESVFRFTHSDTRGGQLDFTKDMIVTMIRCLGVMNVDPRELMEVVQDSNMGKLWPDGAPRFADDGKIIKPAHWEAPELELGRILDSRVRTWAKENEDNDVPF